MKAIDTNILVYGHRSESPFHEKAIQAITELAEGANLWAIPWPCFHEFLAVVTNSKIFKKPTSISDAWEYLDAIRKSPTLMTISENEDHEIFLKKLTKSGHVVGGKIHDARIAAICLEHSVSEFWTADRDYSRFGALKLFNPLIS